MAVCLEEVFPATHSQLVFDVQAAFPGDHVLKAQRQGRNTLIVRSLKPVKLQRTNDWPYRWADYELEHRWHATMEKGVHSVLGNTFQYYREDEIDLSVDLFSQFNCF